MPSNAQDYCEQFCSALDPNRYSNGNWFGRLLAYKYKISTFFGTEYSEDEFRAKIDDGSIKITSISAPYNITSNFGNNISTPGTISGNFDITADIDGVTQTATLNFEHEVKWSIHATKTTLS